MICHNGEGTGLNLNNGFNGIDVGVLLQGSTSLVTQTQVDNKTRTNQEPSTASIDLLSNIQKNSCNDFSRMATSELYLEMRSQLLTLTEQLFNELKTKDGPKSQTDGEPVLNFELFKQWLNTYLFIRL